MSFHPWHDVTLPRYVEEAIPAFIEIPTGSKVKYELDKASGLLRVDRILFSAVRYPANYGFVPRTYCDDGDPLDILVDGQEQIVPLAIMQAEIIGVMRMRDDKGEDDKLVAVPADDPDYADISDISEMPTTGCGSSSASRTTRRWSTRRSWCARRRGGGRRWRSCGLPSGSTTGRPTGSRGDMAPPPKKVARSAGRASGRSRGRRTLLAPKGSHPAMPIYEYACKTCDRSFEELVMRRSDEDDVRCPRCKGKRVEKKMSRPAAARSGGDGGSAASSANCGPVG